MMTRTKTQKKEKSRRYPFGKHPAYDQAFEKAKNKSPIFNENARNLYNTDPINNPEAGIYELKGMPGKDGHYKVGTDWKLAAIPYYKSELAQLNERFKAWQRKQVENGQLLTPSEEWPDMLLDLKLKNQAILDVRKLEVKELEATIAKQEKAAQKKRKLKMLEHGPLTTGVPSSLTEEERKKWSEIDGQEISRNDDGIPFISSEDSPYYGMPLYHYFKMAKAWIKQMGLDNDSLFKERDKLFEEAQKNAVLKKLVLPSKKMGIKALKQQKLTKISEKDFPDWPEDAKPIHEIEVA
ncbi:hypothetical protein ACKGJO_09240 [Gracilimonas sp. Q87]|uniref:hypothetical protein n=1 Tax=Gracilimonas sp. Q87 TaxID=3384766 RepID=UPI0039845584